MADLNYGDIRDIFGGLDEDCKLPMVSKKNESFNYPGNLKHEDESDDSSRGRCSDNEVPSKKNTQRHTSTDDSGGERKKSPVETSTKLSQSQKRLESNDNQSLKNSESKQTKLSHLSLERDRSISVDRSSSSSRSSPKKSIPPENTKRSDTKKETKDYKDKSNRESSEHYKRSHSKLSASRSRSRSPSKHQRRDSPIRERRRSRDRHRDRSPKRRSPVSSRRSRSRSRDRRTRRSNSRNKRSRSRGYRSRSRNRSRSGSRGRRRQSRSYERRHRHRDRSSSRDRYKRRRSRSSSRSRSRGRSTHDRFKGRLSGLNKVASLTLSSSAGPMTPQMALQKTMAAMSAKAQALTGIELPKYYNPAAVNPLKYAEQVQKRKLLWDTKKETKQEQPKSTIWDKLTFNQDQDGKMTEKFRKLMGIKAAGEVDNVEPKEPAASEVPSEVGALKNQEELFRNLDQQYEMARMSTHTHRGVGLGYSTQTIFPPFQKP